MIFTYGWKKLSELYSFKKNPKALLEDIFQKLDKYRSVLPLLDSDELSLLSANSNLSKTSIVISGAQTGYIRNIYHENLAIYLVKEVGFGKMLYLFSDKSCQFAYLEDASGSFQVYDSKALKIGVLDKDLNFFEESGLTASVRNNLNAGNSTIFIGEVDVAGINRITDTTSKVPTRYFSYVDEMSKSNNDVFRILIYASMMGKIV